MKVNVRHWFRPLAVKQAEMGWEEALSCHHHVMMYMKCVRKARRPHCDVRCVVVIFQGHEVVVFILPIRSHKNTHVQSLYVVSCPQSRFWVALAHSIFVFRWWPSYIKCSPCRDTSFAPLFRSIWKNFFESQFLSKIFFTNLYVNRRSVKPYNSKKKIFFKKVSIELKGHDRPLKRSLLRFSVFLFLFELFNFRQLHTIGGCYCTTRLYLEFLVPGYK